MKGGCTWYKVMSVAACSHVVSAASEDLGLAKFTKVHLQQDSSSLYLGSETSTTFPKIENALQICKCTQEQISNEKYESGWQAHVLKTPLASRAQMEHLIM